MKKFKIPYNWKEEDCKKAIKQTLTESAIRFNKNQYDEAAKLLIVAAKIMKEVPKIKRRDTLHGSKKQKKVEKEEEDTRVIDESVDGPNNPFNTSGL